MGLFDKIKSMVGVGQPKMELALKSTQIRRGESIKGTVKLTGGTREIAVSKIIAEHIEIRKVREWSNSAKRYVERNKESIVNKTEIPQNNYLLKQEETVSVEFELPVSTAAVVSGHPYSHKFKISADVPGLDPSKKVEIFIL